jgi:hypothetical protein
MSNILALQKLLQGLHMYKGTKTITEEEITKCIETNFRVYKKPDEEHKHFHDAFTLDMLNGVYKTYLKQRELRRRFYLSPAWEEVKEKAYKLYGKQCMKCGATKGLSVDHIIPRNIEPLLELDLINCQILCLTCNINKTDSIKDYRTEEQINKVLEDKE